ncbi:MAG: hypothetical protein EOO90_11325 [Pedobacter sp.]|nr:MAG: hypothetical protein EOO90_11325 [Pedobacter sp.]
MKNKLKNISFCTLLSLGLFTACKKDEDPSPELSEEKRKEIRPHFRNNLKMVKATKDGRPSRNYTTTTFLAD